MSDQHINTVEVGTGCHKPSCRQAALDQPLWRKQLGQIETEHNALGDLLDDMDSQVAAQQREASANALREAYRRAGVALAAFVADTNLLAEVERIGRPGERRRRFSPVNVPGAITELPAMPAMEAFANCPSPFCAVVFGRTSTERPGANQILVDFDAIEAERRALLQQR